MQVLGAAPGQRTAKLVRALPVVTGPRALGAEVGGVDVHAERATDPLERHDERRVRYSSERAWKDGTHAVVLEPLDLLARLAALVPPPRFRTLRYHGVLASHSGARAAHLVEEVLPEVPVRQCAPHGSSRLSDVGTDLSPRLC